MADDTAEHHEPDPSAAETAAAHADPTSASAAYSRGALLAGATVGIGGIIGAVVTVPALAAALAPAFKTQRFFDIDIGPADLYKTTDPQNPWHVVTFESRPDDQSGIDRRIVFVKANGDGTYVAIANTCMHLGCPVQNFGANNFACPCHGGQYDGEGRRTAGPPVRPLNRYDTRVDPKTGHLILGDLFAMDENLHRHQLKGPGQPVTGLLSYLYPPAPQ